MTSPRKATILLIDDEENLRRSLAMILSREGHAVTVAESLMKARECLQVIKFDLALLDLKLSDENGLSLLPELRRDYPHMPVLILTAHDRPEAAIEAVHQGASDYLLKPIDPPALIKRVRQVLAEQN